MSEFCIIIARKIFSGFFFFGGGEGGTCPLRLCFCADFHSGVYVEKIGLMMFAAYLVSVIIVLVNILIAMMSNTFEEIQVRSDQGLWY